MRHSRASLRALGALLFAFVLHGGCAAPSTRSVWDAPAERVWIGPEYWANRLQDWRLRGGRVECVGTSLSMRTLHLTTRCVGVGTGTLATNVRLGLLDLSEGVGEATSETATAAVAPDAAAGVLIGAGAPDLDWRAAALVQSAPGPEGGFFCGVTADGRIFVRDFSSADAVASEAALSGSAPLAALDLAVRVEPGPGSACALVVEAFDPAGTLLGSVRRDEVGAGDLAGSLALVSHPGSHAGASGEGSGAPAGFWFDDWTVGGTRIERHDDRTVGPILSAMHTLSGGVLKLTAQMMPVGAADPRSVALQVRDQGERKWTEVARAPIEVPGYIATFRIDDWDDRRASDYRLVYAGTTYEGTVRADPIYQPELVLAALSCNQNTSAAFGTPGAPWTADAVWFPHEDLVRGVRAQDPDLVFFAGDQVNASPTPPERGADAELDYLYKWYLFCWAFRDLTRDIPAIAIPDDGDVFQESLWGAGGRPAARADEGGYVMPAEWVRMVERTQTSHLPDPYGPYEPELEHGMGAYYTSLVYGGVGFAVLEDRKFKSGCADLALGGARADHVVEAGFDPRSADVPGKELLGARQLAFLEDWARDWRGHEMKIALSQTSFAGVATHHGPASEALVADLGSNGWPQTARDDALDALRRAFAFHVAGDQHLATLVHHGIDRWDDATWTFAVPAIASVYPRAWLPAGPPAVALAGLPHYAGSRFDGLGNRVTVWAAANPAGAAVLESGAEPASLQGPRPGYGIVRVQRESRKLVVECWPRAADPDEVRQFDGWPKTISQRECYGRAPAAWLPELVVEGVAEPVVQVFTEEGELVYALRAETSRFQPWAFELGTFLVRVGDPERDRWKELKLAAFGRTSEVVRVRLP